MEELDAPQLEAPVDARPHGARREAGPARSRLRNHEVRSETTVHGGSAALFGALFLGVGVFIVLVALDVIHAPDEDFNAPREFVALIGAGAFGLPGLWLTLHGLLGMLRAVTYRNRLARHPDQPWRADHAWDPRGETRSAWRGVWRSAKGALVFAAFALPFQWFLLQDDRMAFLWLAAATLDLIVLGLLCQTALRATRALRYGRSRLHYDWFPFHTGEGASLRLTLSRPRAFDRLRVTLRAVEEAYEDRSDDAQRDTRVVPYCVHEEVREYTGEDARLGSGGELSLEFDIPADAPTTALAERPPTYWELAVRGEIAGADYREVFLVPVYARPA